MFIFYLVKGLRVYFKVWFLENNVNDVEVKYFVFNNIFFLVYVFNFLLYSIVLVE